MTVDWNAILAGTDAKILTDIGWDGEDPSIGSDIAMFVLPSQKKVELQWNDDNECYVVSLYGPQFQALERYPAADANEAIAKVRQFTDPSYKVNKHRVSYLTVLQTFNLRTACAALKDFGYGTYHVGSSLTNRDYHDVDLRCILADDEFDRMFSGEDDPRLKFLNVAISEWIAARCQLPIDFQFQRMTEANEKYPMREHRRNGV